MPSYELAIKTTDDPRGVQSATEETLKLTDAMGKLLQRAQRKEEFTAAKEKIAGMTEEEKKAALEAYKLADAQAKASREISKTGQASGNTTGFLSSLKGSWMELYGAIGVAEKVLQAGQAVWDGTGGKFMDLADRTRELSETIGATSEQASALIAIGDDVQVSADSIQRAFEGAIKRGIDPSIQGLAQLGEEYRAIQDPIAQSRWLMETFGKTGTDVRRLMALTTEELRAMANGAAATGQVISEAEAQMAQEHREAVDAMGDAWGAWSLQVGRIVIPAVTAVGEFLTQFNDYLVAEAVRARGAVKANDDYAASLDRVSAAQEKVAKTSRGNIYTSGSGHRFNPGDEGYNPSGYVQTSGGRASGGPVEAGKLYVINENKPWSGPEVFQAPADGMIYPSMTAAQGGGGGGQTSIEVNLTYSSAVSLSSRREAEEVILPILKNALRNLKVL